MQDFKNNIFDFIPKGGREYLHPGIIKDDIETYQDQDTINIDTKTDPDASAPEYSDNNSMMLEVKALSFEYDEELDVYTYHTGVYFDLPKKYGILVYPAKSICDTNAYVPNAVDAVNIDVTSELIIKFKYRTDVKIYEYFNDTIDNIEKIVDKINEIISAVNTHTDEIASIHSELSSIHSEISALWSAIASISIGGNSISANTNALASTRAAAYIEKLVIKELEKFKDFKKEPYKVGDVIARILFIPYVKVNIKNEENGTT